MLLAAGRRGGDVLRFAGGWGDGGDGDDLCHLLDSRMSGAGFLAGAGAVLGAHGDALAVGLHHDHVAVGQDGVRAAGPPGVEVIHPGGQILGQAGQLGRADLHPGAGFDDLLGLPVPAAGQVIGRQRPHAQRVRVIGQHPPGVRWVQVGFAAVAVGQPHGPHRPEDADHPPLVAFLDGAVPDPRGAGDLLDPFLACGVDGKGRFQQLPLQLPARVPDHCLPLPVIQRPGLPRGPGQHRGELLHRAGQRRRQLIVYRAWDFRPRGPASPSAKPPLPSPGLRCLPRVVFPPPSRNRHRTGGTSKPRTAPGPSPGTRPHRH